MITVRRSQERRYDGRRKCDVWHTFDPNFRADPLCDGFGSIELFEEYRLHPGAGVPSRRAHEAEIVTYVDEGALAFQDSLGRSGVIQAGEFQRLTAGRDLRHQARNASQTESARVFRLWLRPSATSRTPGCEQQRFSAAQRRDGLFLVASPDAQSGALRLQQDASVYSALLHPGHHVVHELAPGRGAWLHIVQGEVTLGDIMLTSGDAAGFTVERAVSLTATRETSLLLVSLGVLVPRLAESVAAPTGTTLFGMLREALVDVLGATATATIVGRATRRALPRSPELAELTISKVGPDYVYALPRSFNRSAGQSVPLYELLCELRPLLAELTGQVVLHRLGQVPELFEWATA